MVRAVYFKTKQSRIENLVLHVVQVLQLMEYCFFKIGNFVLWHTTVVRDVTHLIHA